MAAVGQEEKDIITAKIIETFDGAFMNGPKEIRIPINGMEIKVTLTKAKDNIGGDVATPAQVEVSDPSDTPPWEEPSEEDKRDLEELIKNMF